MEAGYSHFSDGLAHRYVPRVTQKAIRRSAVERLLDQLFGDAATTRMSEA
jgi:hypothetical protein